MFAVCSSRTRECQLLICKRIYYEQVTLEVWQLVYILGHQLREIIGLLMAPFVACFACRTGEGQFTLAEPIVRKVLLGLMLLVLRKSGGRIQETEWSVEL